MLPAADMTEVVTRSLLPDLWAGQCWRSGGAEVQTCQQIIMSRVMRTDLSRNDKSHVQPAFRIINGSSSTLPNLPSDPLSPPSTPPHSSPPLRPTTYHHIDRALPCSTFPHPPLHHLPHASAPAPDPAYLYTAGKNPE